MGLLRRIEGGGSPAPRPSTPATGGGGATPSAPELPPSVAARAPTMSGRPGQNNILRDLRTRVKGKLIAELDPNMDLTKTADVRQRIKYLFDQIVETENIVLTRSDRDRLFEEVAADIIGFGPIEPLLQD